MKNFIENDLLQGACKVQQRVWLNLTRTLDSLDFIGCESINSH
jgi:hypothetical protein